MKTKHLFPLFFVFLFSHSAFSQDVVFDWVTAFSGPMDEFGSSVAVDTAGNIIVVGTFEGTVDFDPGPGVSNLTSAGSSDLYVSKQDSSGNLIWVDHFAGTDTSEGREIFVDEPGNIYITGYFRGTVDFDPGPGTTNLTDGGFDDAYIVKLDPAGNLVWAKQLTGSAQSVGQDIGVDAAGNVITAGYFSGTVDFDPGAGTSSVSSNGILDIFVSKLDASGNFVWIQSFGGTSYEEPQCLVLDTAGNLYMNGYFQDTVDFDPGPGVTNLVSNGQLDAFRMKMDPSGGLVWVNHVGGSGNEFGLSIAVNDAGEVFTTGSFEDTVDFDPGAGVDEFISLGAEDVYVSKLDASGNVVWNRHLGGTGFNQSRDMALNADGDIFISGDFDGTMDIDPGPATYSITSAGGTDILYVMLDDAGNFIWGKEFGGTDEDLGRSVVIDRWQNVIQSGAFSGTSDFDPGAMTFNLTGSAGIDAFVLRLKPRTNFNNGYLAYQSVGGMDWEITARLITDIEKGINPLGVYVDHTITGGSTVARYALPYSHQLDLGNGLFEVWYSDTVTFDVNSIPTDDEHIFTLRECCRTRVANATDKANFVTTTKLVALGTAESFHSSKELAFFAPPLIHRGEAFDFRMNLFDKGADSSAFATGTISPVQIPGGIDPGWTAPSGLSLNPADQTLSWTPADTGLYTFMVEVDEFSPSSGKRKGSNVIEMQFRVVEPPVNSPPTYKNTASWPTNTDGEFEFEVEVGVLFSLLVETADSDGDPLSALQSGGENNNATTNTATFTPVIVDDSTIQGTFEWLPDSLDHREKPYEMTFRVFEEVDDLTLNTDITVFLKTNLGVGIQEEVAIADQPVVLYPNPVSDRLAIKLRLAESQSLNAMILSSEGKLVRQFETQFIKAGDLVLVKDVSDLSSGNYLLKIQGSNGYNGTARLLIK